MRHCGPGWALGTGGSQGVRAPRGPWWTSGSWGCPGGFGHRKSLGDSGTAWGFLHSKVITVPPVAGSLIVQGEENESFPVFGGVCVSPRPCCCRTLILLEGMG